MNENALEILNLNLSGKTICVDISHLNTFDTIYIGILYNVSLQLIGDSIIISDNSIEEIAHKVVISRNSFIKYVNGSFYIMDDNFKLNYSIKVIK